MACPVVPQSLADLVSQKDLDVGSLYPPLEDIQHCSSVIAHRVVEYAYKHGRRSLLRHGWQQLGLTHDGMDSRHTKI